VFVSQVPHYVPWINVLRGGLNAVLAWVALLACILSFTVEWEYDHGHPVWHDEEYRHIMTVVSAALCSTPKRRQPHALKSVCINCVQTAQLQLLAASAAPPPTADAANVLVMGCTCCKLDLEPAAYAYSRH
jgi:hypothetical protein